MSYAASKRGKIQSARAEEARRAAEEQARREAAARRRRKLLLIGGGAAVVVAISASIVISRVQDAEARERLRGPKNMRSDGLVIYGDTEQLLGLVTEANGPDAPAQPTGDTRMLGVADLKFFVDYTDPQPAALWAAQGEALSQRMINGDVSLEIHPIGFDDTGVAAAAALACVANVSPDSGLAAHTALLAAQDTITAASPAELPAVLKVALTDGGLVLESEGAAEGAKVLDGVADCIDSGRFQRWVEEATERAENFVVYPATGPVTRSTFFFLDLPYDGAPDDTLDFMSAVEASVLQLQALNAKDQQGGGEAPVDGGNLVVGDEPEGPVVPEGTNP